MSPSGRLPINVFTLLFAIQYLTFILQLGLVDCLLAWWAQPCLHNYNPYLPFIPLLVIIPISISALYVWKCKGITASIFFLSVSNCIIAFLLLFPLCGIYLYPS